MQLLQAINEILPALGEHTVSSVDERHPTVAVILNALYSETDDMLLKGWWFNSYELLLYPEDDGRIALPTDTLEVRGAKVPVVQRGDYAWNPTNFSFLWDGPVKVYLKQRLVFSDLPESAARYVLYSACVKAYETDIGVEAVVKEWQNRAGLALGLVTAEHLRNAKFGTLQSRQFRHLRWALRG